MKTLEQVRRIDLTAPLDSLLTWAQRKDLDRLAPTHVTVPSGSHIRLDYEAGDPPVLAVRLQEMFGCRDTPRLAGGKIPVMVHLLSPAGRPVQVTKNLASFWAICLSGGEERIAWPLSATCLAGRSADRGADKAGEKEILKSDKTFFFPRVGEGEYSV